MRRIKTVVWQSSGRGTLRGCGAAAASSRLPGCAARGHRFLTEEWHTGMHCSQSSGTPEYTARRAVAHRDTPLTGAALTGTALKENCFLAGAALMVAACTALLGGCRYSTERPFSREFQTIHVEMFDSREFRRELEFRLTEALVKRIEMDTPYRISERETADVLLTGEILSVGNRTFGTDFETGLPREIGSSVAVRFQVKDLRTGAILVDRPRFVYQTHYIPPVGESFDKGMVRGLDGLAEAMVETMETPW
ncbi:MAG: LptE family protein [Phycisphaerales bacterium]|nr:LptE family protein [Phycisphaerales bacterium]